MFAHHVDHGGGSGRGADVNADDILLIWHLEATKSFALFQSLLFRLPDNATNLVTAKRKIIFGERSI